MNASGWRKAPCARCGVVHPRYCDLCAQTPPCQDHECSWPEDADACPKTVSSLDEWFALILPEDAPPVHATGELADEIRTRFSANKHTAVTLHETYEDVYTGCDCRGGTDRYLVIECGEHEKRFDISDGLRHGTYWDWLDEPRRRAKREAAEQARTAQQAVNDQAFTSAVVGHVVTSIAAVEVDGYANDGEWHDKLMDQLGVKGHRYGD